jgi:hypothetical protein
MTTGTSGTSMKRLLHGISCGRLYARYGQISKIGRERSWNGGQLRQRYVIDDDAICGSVEI